MPSSVTDAQARLTALIETTFSATTTHRQFGLPLDVPKKHERVYVLEDEVDYTLGGPNQWRDEVYAIQVAIEVYRAGKSSLEAVTRRRAMVVALDAALYAADFYGYASDEDRAIEVDPITVAYDKGFLAKAIIDIPVTHRL